MLIDTGCLQTNVVSERIATLLRKDGIKLRPANLVLTSGVGGVSYAVQGSITMTVALPIPDETVKYRHIFVDSIVWREVTSDLIISLPSITYYHLQPILQHHLASKSCCQLCAPSDTHSKMVPQSSMMATIMTRDSDHAPFIMSTAQWFNYSDGPLPKPLPQHHTAYDEPMTTMIAELHAVADTTLVPTYTDPIELSQAVQGLHMRDMLGYDDDGADKYGVNDIDITRMVQHNLNHDNQLGGNQYNYSKPNSP